MSSPDDIQSLQAPRGRWCVGEELEPWFVADESGDPIVPCSVVQVVGPKGGVSGHGKGISSLPDPQLDLGLGGGKSTP